MAVGEVDFLTGTLPWSLLGVAMAPVSLTTDNSYSSIYSSKGLNHTPYSTVGKGLNTQGVNIPRRKCIFSRC